MCYIVVCDDDKMQRNILNDIIIKYSSETGHIIKVDFFNDGKYLIDSNKKYDGYLLDIEMEHTNGIEAAKTIVIRQPAAILIFVTAHNYVNDVLKLQPEKYLYKPINEKDMYSVLDMILNKYYEARRQITLMDKFGRTIDINLKDIIILNIENRKTTIRTLNGVYTTTSSFECIEKMLKGYDFIHIYKRSILSLRYITKICDKCEDVEVYHKDGIKKIHVGRTYRENFMSAWNLYIRRQR